MLLEGTLFDDTYRLIRLVGEGAMGAVYEASHARLEGRYVIKVLQQSLSRNAESLALFHLEARITSLLQHPNIVQVVDHNTTADGIDYLAMEYLAGETLAARLVRAGSLPLDAVVGIVEQIAAGLAAAHAHGIVHRDLKPDNVFLVPVEGRQAESVKILDFGISKVRDPSWGLQAPVGTVWGTPLYMSPEQVEGRADVDDATDQFALAVITYEMLTGRNPFQADSVSDVFSRVQHRDPEPMGVGRDVELVVRRGLAKSSRQRFASVTDFSDALRAATVGRARESQRSAKIAYAAGQIASLERKRSSRQRKWAMALAAAVAVNLSIYLAVAGVAHRPASPVPTLSNVESRAPRQVRPPVVDQIQPTQKTLPPRVSVPTLARRAARSPAVARDRRPSQSRWTFVSTTSIPRSAATPYPVDDDATMPASEQ